MESTSSGPIRSDLNDGYGSLTVTLNRAQLSVLATLAENTHDGEVRVQHLRDDAGLEWIEITTLVTDGDDPRRPLTTTYMTPQGHLSPEIPR